MTDNLFRVKNGIDVANAAITANSTVLNLNNAVISANGHVGDAGQVIFSDGTKNYYGFIVSAPPAPPGANSQIVFNDSGSSNAISNFSFNKTTNTITIGSATISPSTYTGSANNASYLGGIAAVNYQTLAGLSANVATLSANNSSYLNGQPASYYANSTVINVCVRTDITQTFSTGEKIQGRTNLGLASVASTGAYADLTGAPSLATVATSGNYSDLTNKPTIPAAQVNADWNASSGVAQILNKPTIPDAGQPIPTSSTYAVGTFLLASIKSGMTVADGTTTSGTNLRLVSAWYDGSFIPIGYSMANSFPALPGTWKNVSGFKLDFSGNLGTGIVGNFVRVA